MPLFEKAKAYNTVYNWFSHLKKDGCEILSYVVMPNHLHCLLLPTRKRNNLNLLVSEGKRFMAYAIVKGLKMEQKETLLSTLQKGVKENEKRKGKKHQVFRLSFDARECFDEKMAEQKLEYIHHNPVNGRWRLAGDFADYQHSSAAYYEKGEENIFVTHYKEIKY